MKDQIELNVEELEERIAPDSVNGVPGESNGNPGNEVSNGHQPQPGTRIQIGFGLVSYQAGNVARTEWSSRRPVNYNLKYV
jgi:hypothetical protein